MTCGSFVSSNRLGLMAYKLGMSLKFLEDGNIAPITLLKIDDNVVLRVAKKENGMTCIVIGFSKRRRMKKPLLGIAKKAGVDSFKYMREFNVCGDFPFKVGDKLPLDYFIPNQFVDISGFSRGKGFAGGMKRHGFAGLEASHGVSVSHRSSGSTGQCQDPGRVFKGKKMAGQMGSKKVTVQNLRVVEVDQELGILAVFGAVPGGDEMHPVIIRDAKKKMRVEEKKEGVSGEQVEAEVAEVG